MNIKKSIKYENIKKKYMNYTIISNLKFFYKIC